MMHYLYVLSSWSLVAEDAVQAARDKFGSDLAYDWTIAITDYGGTGRLRRDQLEFYYARLEAATGQKMDLNWWHEGYDWLAPDKVVVAARLLGATDNTVRLRIANAGLREGQPITNVDRACKLASEASGLAAHDIARMANDPQTLIALRDGARAFSASGVNLRPAFVLENDLGDRVVLSGIWNREPIETAITALLTDERSYLDFLAKHPEPAA